jgi:hypothetical protein
MANESISNIVARAGDFIVVDLAEGIFIHVPKNRCTEKNRAGILKESVHHSSVWAT